MSTGGGHALDRVTRGGDVGEVEVQVNALQVEPKRQRDKFDVLALWPWPQRQPSTRPHDPNLHLVDGFLFLGRPNKAPSSKHPAFQSDFPDILRHPPYWRCD